MMVMITIMTTMYHQVQPDHDHTHQVQPEAKVVKKVCWIGGGRSALTCKQVGGALIMIIEIIIMIMTIEITIMIMIMIIKIIIMMLMLMITSPVRRCEGSWWVRRMRRR